MSDDSLEKQLNEGKKHFMRMEWSQAEDAFLNLLRCIETLTNNNWDPRYDVIKVEALAGLGELETRRCRRFCYDDITWFKGMFRSLTFYNDALACIIRRRKHLGSKFEVGKERENEKKKVGGKNNTNNNSKAKENTANKSNLDSNVEENAFFNQTQAKIMFQIKTIEDSTNKILTDKILKNCLVSSNARTLTFNDEWLRQMALFCSEERKQPKTGCNGRTQSIEQTINKQQQNQLENQKEENFQPVYKRKIDFDRVQEAIMQLVNDVSIDVRRNYSHVTRLVPQQLIQQRLMLEVTRRLTPGSRDNVDLMKVLENAIVYEDPNPPLAKSSKRTSECNASLTDQTTLVDFDDDNDRTIYMNIETCQPESIEMKIRNRKFSFMDDGAESNASVLTSVKDFTRASSPSCYSKKSHAGRFVHHIDAASSSRLSQATYAKTNSSKRSGLIYEINGMPSKATRMKNILTVWRSHKPKGAPSGTSSNATTCQRKSFYSDLQSFEEVSPLSEREKVLNWLKSVEEPAATNATATNTKMSTSKSNYGSTNEYTPSSQNQTANTFVQNQEQPADVNNILNYQLTKEKLNYTVAIVAKKSAENLSKQGNFSEALEVFKFALSILKANSTGSRHEKELIAELLRNIGMTKCSLGQISVGCQLMQESVSLYSKLENMSESSRISEIWFQLGGAFLSEELRKDSLFLRTMQLIQKELNNESTRDLLNSCVNDDDYEDDSSECSDDSDKEDGYCVCIYEAMECYKQSLNLFNNLGQNGLLLNSELYIHVLCNLADCYFMAGNLDLAEVYYEEALLLFPRARGSPTMQENSHVLSMLGSLNFMLGNYVRSATMYETSHILNQHRSVGRHDEPTLQQAWNIAMLGLSCYYLGHFDKTVAWCTRAFTLYTRVLRGSLFNADYYNHWFVIENLYSLGTAYATMNFFEKAIYYLNLGRNLINGCEVSDRQDPKQHVKVLRALADSHASIEENDVALRFYEEAVEVSKKLGENNSKTALQNQLLNSMASVNVDTKNYNDAENNLEQALDYQKDVEMSIKLDMVAVLKRLGATSVLACDVDKAIGCYKDCIQATRELRWMPNQWEDIACMLCTLATLYHVKSCMLDDENQMELFMTMSEGCFQEAIVITEDNSLDIRIEVECAVDLQYANFLYQQGLYADALHVLLPTTFGNRPKLNDLVYSGIEQAVLPDHLQSDFYDDSMIIDAKTFAYFLAILCYKSIGLSSEADDVLVMLYKSALNPHSKAFLCNVCGYALLEMKMFKEACEMFYYSATVKSIYTPLGNKTALNFYICVCLYIYVSYTKIFRSVFDQLRKSHKQKIVIEKKDHEIESSSSIKRQLSSQDGSDLAFCSDSGGEMVETWEEWTEETIQESRKVHWDENSFAQNSFEGTSSGFAQKGAAASANQTFEISKLTTDMNRLNGKNNLNLQEQRYQEVSSLAQPNFAPLLLQQQQQQQQQLQFNLLQKPENHSPQFSDSSTYSNTSDYSSQALNYSREVSDEVWKDDSMNANEPSNDDEDEISETFEEIVYDVPVHMLPNNYHNFSSNNNNFSSNNILIDALTSSSNSNDTISASNSNNNLSAKTKNEEHNKMNDEMSTEINGNLMKNPSLQLENPGQREKDQFEEYEEWVTVEEVVDTPIEILAILNRNNNLNNNFNNNNNITTSNANGNGGFNNLNNKANRTTVGLYV